MERHLKIMKLKVKVYLYTIVYAKNCTITLTDSKGNCVFIEKGGIFFLERNVNVSVSIETVDNSKPYEIFSIDNDKLRNIIKVFEPFYMLKAEKNYKVRPFIEKIFSIKGSKINTELFYEAMGERSNFYALVYLLSKVECLERLYISLNVSGSKFFTDKVKELIENDISKKWKLSSVAGALNLSEIAVRKKLEYEDISFNQLLLDVRMKFAAKLILECDHHINKVSSILGISSVSYFIKLFSNYYGITPKQFYIYHKSVSKF
ncbi:AraC family transcriptional regulator [Klebsiella aerogenes]|nr:AraC family transcriptional regulator [Klebsiella aerogenes]ELY3087272.1 AraC family transcriptional regulator [Klebsiella aerogenes]